MKKILMLLLLGTIMAIPYNTVAQESVYVITEAWPPYVIEDENGQPSGILYDMAQEVFKSMDYTMTFKFYPWKRCKIHMQKQTADALLGVNKNEELEKYLIYPKEPFFSYSTVFFFKKGDEFNYDGMESLTGKVVGTFLGYTYNEEFNNAANFKKESVGSYEQNFKKLFAGRIDLIIGNRDVYLYVAQKMGILDQIGYSPNALIVGQPNYLGFAQKESSRELAHQFSEALKAFKQTERYMEIYNSYTQ